MRIKIFCVFLSIVTIHYCTEINYQIRRTKNPRISEAKKILIQKPLLMQSISKIKVLKDSYETNQYIGFIYFSGGFIRQQRDIGFQVSP